MDFDNPTIAEIYKGKNVFITGGSGFIGKALIDKLLRSCPDVGYIYVLLRPKKGKGIEERLQDVLNDMLFDTLKNSNPSQISKLIPVAGDCVQLSLGLCPQDYSLLKSSIHVIFHVAASVRFDDPLSYAILLNTRGTREVCSLALEVEKLSALVHVSTTYSNCVASGIIEEQFYPPPDNWQRAIEIAEKFDNAILPVFTDKYLGPYPNTYTFTKALGETVVKDMCLGKIPVVICRPSIVLSTLRDPVKGWIDNFNGPMGLLIASGKGLVRIAYQDTNIHPDYIPVDMVVHSLIVASWDTALKRDLSTIEVLNCCSCRKWISIIDLGETCKDYSKDYPFNGTIWVPKGSPTNYKYYAYICTVFFQLLPAFFLDLGLKIYGKKPILTRLQTKIYGALIQLRYFSTQDWTFKNTKFLELEKRIHTKDKSDWSYNYSNEDILQYTINSMLGCRKYLLKESEESLPAAKRHYWRMYWLNKVAMTIYYGSIIWIILSYDIHEKIINYVIGKFVFYTNGYSV